ncbi:GDP-L-fucose synthase [Blastomonas sp. AAP53]|uniref:GDP-L-fucose synthase family protein n=1 Tax=Blastomonas sp. AAP53 TaxID=1248760 RepID=UPI0002E9BE21|nr:GDP-L-fucose synthase [Blastomonas sp. AAP53]
MFELKGKRIFVAGHKGMVGSSMARQLAEAGAIVITADRSELDLINQASVDYWMADQTPEIVVVAAAKVGGILANDLHPVSFLYDNIMIQTNLLKAAHATGVDRLLLLGSSCIYPKFAPQPITEDALLTGALEPTNQWYAMAKISGIMLGQAYRREFGRHYISAMPTNLYGPGDNFDLQSSHVLPALIRKAHEAKVSGAESIEVWGTGKVRREFLHVDDCAGALVHLLRNYDEDQHINVGSGSDVTILELVQIVCDVVGFTGAITFDTTKPDGTPRKLMAADKLGALGWSPTIELREGIERTYAWFCESIR